MKKPSSRIREEIARLQEQLKATETREAERIGRLALRAGLGDLAIDEVVMVSAFEEMAARFRGGGSERRPKPPAHPTVEARPAPRDDEEALAHGTP